VRQQSADLIGKIAAVMKRCGEDQLLNHLGVVLYEYLGEEYPEVRTDPDIFLQSCSPNPGIQPCEDRIGTGPK